MDEIKKLLEKKLVVLKEELEHAYADGNSDSDYIEGLIDAYEIVYNAIVREESKCQ